MKLLSIILISVLSVIVIKKCFFKQEKLTEIKKLKPKIKKTVTFKIPEKPKNPIVFLEISVNNKKIGELIIELFEDVVPKTTKNFLELCTNNKLTYKNNLFHRIIPEFMCQGGDITNGDGSGGLSIYGKKFKDENFKLKHSVVGLLSMANAGPNTNSSQFFITFRPTPWLDDKHVVFGRVIRGFPILSLIEDQGTEDGTPRNKVTISNCGIVK